MMNDKAPKAPDCGEYRPGKLFSRGSTSLFASKSSALPGAARSGGIPGRNRPVDDGFSLLELLVAFVVIVFALLTTAQLLLLSRAVQNRYRDHVQALATVAERLEHFRSLPFDSPELAPGRYRETLGDAESERSVTLNWTISPAAPRLKSEWIACARTGYPERKVETVLFLSRDLEFYR